MNTRSQGFLFILSLMAWCLLLAIPLVAQEKKGLDPESLPQVLAEGAVSLEKVIAAGKADAEALQQKVKQAKVNLYNLRAQIATLKASQAAGELQLDQAQKALESFLKREGQVAGQINEVQKKQEQLSKQVNALINAFSGLKQEVDRLKAVKHPIVNSPEVRKAYERYQQLANQYQAGAAQFLERFDDLLRVLGQERQVLTEVGEELTSYVKVGWKEELLKRQPPVSLWETMKQTWQALLELPERFTNYLTDPNFPKKVAASLRAKWAQLLGLLALFLILAWASFQLRRLALPKLRRWQDEVAELGPKIIFKAGEIIVTHLFGLSVIAWLALTVWTLGWWYTRETSVLLIGVSVWVGLRMGLKLIQAVFAGKTKGGILPLDEKTARFYRRNFKLLLIYVLIIGFFGLNLLRGLGIEPASYEMLEEIIEVGFLVWVLWLLRRKYFENLRTNLPGPAWIKGRGFFLTVRALIILVLGGIFLTSLLGFQNLSAYIADAATLIGLVIVLFWVIWQGARAVLEHIIHPKTRPRDEQVWQQEELLRKYYVSIMKVVVTIIVAGALALILNLWGIDLSFLPWFFKILDWGPKLGPFQLTFLKLGLAVLALYLGRWFSRFLRTFLEVKFYPTTDWDESIRYTISNTFHYIIWAITIIMALGFLGVSFGHLAIVAGGLGIGIGFGLQGIVNNFISGLIILYERPIKVGDMLIIDGQWGLVKEIRVRSTIFQIFDRSVLVIPNSELISGKILNWTYFGPGINRLTLKVGVSYGSDVRQVTKILDEVCRANPRVVPDPPPTIYFEAYGDSSLNFTIWAYLRTPNDIIRATHELNSAIFEAFQEHGIEIPFPQRDLHVKSWPGASSPSSLPPNNEE
jgi:small-conductance mechanosensitive channel